MTIMNLDVQRKDLFMAAAASLKSYNDEFSPCSLNYIHDYFTNDYDTWQIPACLENMPTVTFGDAVSFSLLEFELNSKLNESIFLHSNIF